eukprot:g962.t1
MQVGGFLYYLFLCYFILHIPITLFIDLQGVLPSSWYPPSLRWLIEDFYQEHFQDVLMRDTPPWFQGLLWCEGLLQLPFLFYGTVCFWRLDNAIRLPCLIYCTHVLTTMVPILFALLSADLATIYKLRLLV